MLVSDFHRIIALLVCGYMSESLALLKSNKSCLNNSGQFGRLAECFIIPNLPNNVLIADLPSEKNEDKWEQFEARPHHGQWWFRV